jgi:hypothetical protein
MLGSTLNQASALVAPPMTPRQRREMLRRCGRLVAGGKGGDDAFRLMAGP